MIHADLLGINWNDFFHAFLMFVAAYFGTKHGTGNGLHK